MRGGPLRGEGEQSDPHSGVVIQCQAYECRTSSAFKLGSMVAIKREGSCAKRVVQTRGTPGTGKTSQRSRSAGGNCNAKGPAGRFFFGDFFFDVKKKVTRREAKKDGPEGRRVASPRRHPLPPPLSPFPPLPAQHGRQIAAPTWCCLPRRGRQPRAPSPNKQLNHDSQNL